MNKISAYVVALGLALAVTGSTAALADDVSLSIRVNLAPPALPVYAQPPLPGPGYIWVPGYWAWDPTWQDYYWVPGVWVMAPRPGLLWTPPWWGWVDGVYVFHHGYWGPHVGFYGGISYGFGYTGNGYQGGYWNHGQFFYNQTVNHITNVNITNVYNKTVIVNRTEVRNVSFNGGPQGIQAQPTAAQLHAMQEHHIEATDEQRSHFEAARARTEFRYSANHGLPPIGATNRAGEFENREMTTGASAPEFRPERDRGMGAGQGWDSRRPEQPRREDQPHRGDDHRGDEHRERP